MIKKELNLNKGDLLFAKLSYLSVILCFCLVLFFAYRANEQLKTDADRIKNADLSKDISLTIDYDDSLYAMIGFGISLDPMMSDKEELLASFYEKSLQKIDDRILSAGCVYVLAIGALCSYGLFYFYGGENRKYILHIVFLTLGVYLLYAAAMILFHQLNGISFHFPETGHVRMLFLGILSIIAGLSASAFFLKVIRFRKIAAIFLLLLIVVLFLFGFVREYGLYNEPQLESFDYLYEMDEAMLEEDFVGDLYYDDQKGVMVYNGKEYPPQRINNPEHYTGLKKAGAVFLEMIDPFSGCALPLLKEEGIQVPIYADLLYVIKAVFWILLLLKNDERLIIEDIS